MAMAVLREWRRHAGLLAHAKRRAGSTSVVVVCARPAAVLAWSTLPQAPPPPLLLCAASAPVTVVRAHRVLEPRGRPDTSGGLLSPWFETGDYVPGPLGPTPPPSSSPSPYDPEYHTNMGRAIETLRRDTPYMLERDPDFSVYAPNMVFRESIWGHGVLHGLDTYRRALRWIRVLLRWSFSRPSVEVTNVINRGSDAVQIWWSFHAIPRSLPGVLLGAAAPRDVVRFDGISVYHFDRRGRVCSHDIINILPPPEALSHVRTLQAIFGTASGVPAPSC